MLHCDRQSDLSCGFTQEYTASCTGGKAVVDLYAYDEERGIFGQADGSTLVVPTACDSGGDDSTKMCHFRFVLECESSPWEDESRNEDLLARNLGELRMKSVMKEPSNVEMTIRKSFFSYFFLLLNKIIFIIYF